MSQVEYDVDDENEENEDEQYVAVEDDPNGDREDVDGNVAEDDEEYEDDDDLDARVAGNRDEDDDDDKRKARRQENKSRRARQKEARERTERELTFLRNRNADLEQRFSRLETEVDARVTGSELSAVDQQINKAKSDLQLANQVIAQAADNNDGANLAEALNHRDTIRDSLRDLEQAKEYLTQERQAQQPQRELDPRHRAHADQFMRDNDWWDPRGQDQESQTVLMIDRSLVQEGYDPTTKQYWDVLRERVQQALPDRFAGDDDVDDDDDPEPRQRGKGKKEQQRRGGEGPEFRTGGRERPLQKNEVYISPERREAMEEAGVWDDPVLRNKYLKAYAEYDRNAEEEGA